MKIYIHSRAELEATENDLRELVDALAGSGARWAVNAEFASVLTERLGIESVDIEVFTKPDSDGVVVSYGGDGTFLEATRIAAESDLPLLGINIGRLGFLAHAPKEDLSSVFGDLVAGNYAIMERTMLYIEGDFSKQPDFPYAFNEFTIQREAISMTSVDVAIDGEKLATYYGDGVIISTSAGSTAYSLSVGGPIIAPDCACFCICPIAPHNLTMRPIVVPDKSEVKFTIRSREPYSYISIDNRGMTVANGSQFRVTKRNKPLRLVSLAGDSFYDTLRKKMMWGFDKRD